VQQCSPTRMELQKINSQVVLAIQGRDLLRQKMDALIQEFFLIMESATRSRDELEKTAEDARRALLIARAVDDTITLKSASFATKRSVVIDIHGRKVMGINIPVLEKKSFRKTVIEREYSIIGVSSRIDETAEAYEKELDLVIGLAETETALRKISHEIEITKRRVNALEEVVIPELKETGRYIRTTIEEREREDIFRLKKVKKILQKKKEKM